MAVQNTKKSPTTLEFFSSEYSYKFPPCLISEEKIWKVLQSLLILGWREKKKKWVPFGPVVSHCLINILLIIIIIIIILLLLIMIIIIWECGKLRVILHSFSSEIVWCIFNHTLMRSALLTSSSSSASWWYPRHNHKLHRHHRLHQVGRCGWAPTKDFCFECSSLFDNSIKYFVCLCFVCLVFGFKKGKIRQCLWCWLLLV